MILNRKMFGGALAAIVAIAVMLGGCDNKEEEELKKQITMQIDLIEREIVAVEQHQEAMRQMIQDTQAQLALMQEELNKEAPRIHAANSALGSLKNLTMYGLGESPLESTVKEPSWSYGSVLWLLLFVFILWFLYRIRSRHETNQ